METKATIEPRESPTPALDPRSWHCFSVAAEALGVCERAVEKHVTSIFSKLDLTPAVADHRRVLAVLTFLRSA
jgi:hypothetical protein